MRLRAIPILSRMNRGRTISLMAAAALAAAAGSLAACGSDSGDGNRLSRSTASELRSTVDRVEQDVDRGDCEAATTQARALVERAGGLPNSVDSGLREALVDSADRLQVLVTQGCSTSSTEPSGRADSGATAQTGPTGPTDEQENQEKPGKKKAKVPKKDKEPKNESPGPTGEDQTGSDGGDGLDNEDSGGVAP
jgi:outer membrane murein-binding lipoprotein Lpp